MIPTQEPTALTLYRWINPNARCDNPFLAVAEDCSVLLGLGDHRLSFEWSVSVEAVSWLAQDFMPTGEQLSCDLSTLRYVIDTIFLGGVECGILSFDEGLKPCRLELALTAQTKADAGPEYLIEGVGSYQRRYRASQEVVPVSPAERAMLELCVATFADLENQYRALLAAPPPPRYRPS